jgi:hypothetical protein
MNKKTSKKGTLPDFNHWNHRVVYENEVFGICEVIYDKKNKPYAWSEPIVVSDTIEGLLQELTLMAGACIKPVLIAKKNKLWTKKI